MRNYSVEVTTNDFKNLKHQEVFSENNIKQRLQSLAPDCVIDWHKIFNDKRCRYFRHYMPINVTKAKNSYRKCNELSERGNYVKVFITEI